MPEQLQKILDKILEWWKKFSTKQKALLLSIIAVIIIALVILSVVISQPTMVTLVSCSTTSESNEVKTALDSAGVSYELSTNGLVFTVEEEDYATASITLGASGIPSTGPDIDDVFGSGLSTTEADKTKRYKLYLEEYYAQNLEALSNVEVAYVTLDLPDEDGTILSQDEEAYISVILELNGEMDDDQAAGLAKYLATNVGNDDTSNVLILDSDSNVLYSGEDETSTTGTASTQLSLKTKAESLVKSQVKDVLVGSSMFDNVEVGLNLDMNFDQTTESTHEYYAPDGQTNGMIGSKSEYESEAVNGTAAVPGTDSNGDDTTYVLEDDEYTSSTVSETNTDYQNNEKITTTTPALGTVDYDESSISVVATNYVIYSEDALEAAGELDDMTFEEYILANSDPVKTTVDDDLYTLISSATGVPTENITIVAYEEPMFQYSSSSGKTVSDYMQIILAVLIFLLLGYVVFRSTRKEKTAEPEPELSVESLLESTKEAEALPDLGVTEKSEARIQIEKFVEENPEAAASLLRNWLNEEWE